MLFRLLTVLAITLLISCASTPKGENEANIAAGFALQQRYGAAIEAIDSALQKEPKNKTYLETRRQYLDSYSSSVKKQAQDLLAGKPDKKSLDEAEQLISEAISTGVLASKLSGIARNVKTKREKLYSNLERSYRRGSRAMSESQWVEAYHLLSEVNKLYPNYEDTSQRLARVRQQASKDYLGLAGRALKADELDDTRNAANQMLAIDPKNNMAKNLLRKADERDSEDYFDSRVDEAVAADDSVALKKYCNKVLTYAPDDERCRQKLANLDKVEASALVEQASSHISSGQLFNAADNYFKLHQFEGADFASARGAIKGRLAKQLNHAAVQAADEDKPGQAWVIYEKLAEVDPSYPGLHEARRATEDIIRENTRKSIAVFDFNSPSDNADAGIIVANNLIARLFNNAGRDIKILERENLKSILEEMKLGQIGVVSEGTAKEMGRIYGIDYAIMGSVLLYKVDTIESRSSKTVRYQIGEEIEDNIDYLNWLAVNPQPKKSELANAPRAKIKVPKYAITEYDVAEIKKVAFIGVSFRIVDVLTGENTRVDTIEKVLEVRDTSNEGLAEAGVVYDRMEIPTDTELLQLLTDEVVDIMSVDVLRPLQSLEKTYFERGEKYEKRSEFMKAIERYVDGIFNERVKSVGTSPLTTESQKRIQQIMHAKKFDV